MHIYIWKQDRTTTTKLNDIHPKYNIAIIKKKKKNRILQKL